MSALRLCDPVLTAAYKFFLTSMGTFSIIETIELAKKLNIPIKSGGGTGPMKPSNRPNGKVPNPAVDVYVS